MEVIAFILITITVIGIQSWLFGRFVLTKLEYTCNFSMDEAYEGDSLFLVETVQNKKLMPVPWLKVDINSSRWLEFANTKSVIAQDFRYVTSNFFLKGHQKITRRWNLKCHKRGVYTVKNVTLISGDLVGRRTVSNAVAINAVLTVFPSLIALEDYFIPMRQLQGDIVVKRWINDDPFTIAGAREYSAGDPMNRIHWSASARQGQLMVRKNDFTAQTGITVLLNVQSIETEYTYAVRKELIELGIKASASIFDISLTEGIPVRFATNGSTIYEKEKMIYTEEASGREHIRGLMSILASLELRCIKDFEDFFEGYSIELRDTDIILITAYLTEKIIDLIRTVQKQNCSVKIMILDKFIEQGKIPQDMNVYILSEDEEKYE